MEHFLQALVAMTLRHLVGVYGPLYSVLGVRLDTWFWVASTAFLIALITFYCVAYRREKRRGRV